MNEQERLRYDRHIILPEIGIAGQTKLKEAKVLMIGAGGLGCPVLSYLAAAGIGTIGIVDFDVVDESNLQRQVLFGVSSLGKNKAEVAKERLTDLNPFISIHTYPVRLTTDNALEIIQKYDVVVDGTDNFATRYLVNDACTILDKPLVYGSIYRFEGQVTVLNFSDNSSKGPTYRCLFPTPPPPDTVPNCSQIGVIGVLPGIIGTLQANEVIKIITKVGSPLSGKLILYDALQNQFTTINIKRDEQIVQQVIESKAHFKQMNYEHFCNASSNEKNRFKEITAEELKLWIKNENIQIIDVREAYEQPKINALMDMQIPLGVIGQQVDKIERNKKVVVFCKSGIRSASAIKQLENEYGFTNLYNLKGGLMSW